MFCVCAYGAVHLFMYAIHPQRPPFTVKTITVNKFAHVVSCICGDRLENKAWKYRETVAQRRGFGNGWGVLCFGGVMGPLPLPLPLPLLLWPFTPPFLRSGPLLGIFGRAFSGHAWDLHFLHTLLPIAFEARRELLTIVYKIVHNSTGYIYQNFNVYIVVLFSK